MYSPLGLRILAFLSSTIKPPAKTSIDRNFHFRFVVIISYTICSSLRERNAVNVFIDAFNVLFFFKFFPRLSHYFVGETAR